MRLREQQFSMRKREKVWTCLRKNADGLHKEQLTRARRSTVKKQEAHAEGSTANESEERRGRYTRLRFLPGEAHMRQRESALLKRSLVKMCYLFFSILIS